MDILITGGTGSFGRAFTKHLLDNNLVRRVCIYSRDEVKQANMRRELGDDGRLRFFIGDVRDKDRLNEAFRGVDVVVHAAALKRIEVGYYNPAEMVKTNVMGTINVIQAAANNAALTVVGLSTDKAWQPISAYGQSKALAESLVLSANNVYGENGPDFKVTRYGNVSGSTGSVIPAWREMIAAGATEVPVTDPNCTRFWMTMGEAVELVMSAILLKGKLHIPTLPAYRVGDLAEAMGVDIRITGLPEWEKKHEGMADGNTSDKARRMTVEELKEALKNV